MSHTATVTRKNVSYKPTLVGLGELIEEAAEVRSVIERLPLRVLDRELQERLTSFENFVRMVAEDKPGAAIDRTVGYGAKWLRDAECALDKAFEEAVRTLEGSADYIRQNAPDLFLANEDEITKLLVAYKAAVTEEENSFEEILEAYLPVREILMSLQTQIKEERVAAERAEENRRRATKEAEVRSKLRSFSKAFGR